ncbi:hypothetical protein XU18_3237 [Perkinsela sp. CCAP 1560/4]|nr:hypothetical protein XU18_4554 [Perkinsela sp. CCAP 1560/4]KNH05792.1 hypothetical protein XU18_3237 [Perkinsela sp. CCAP 1560/4]|eukprot:KNH04130.1 hypothetical protein XU18_4554 [Perkinsela sp. CCAP 1560/4]
MTLLLCCVVDLFFTIDPGNPSETRNNMQDTLVQLVLPDGLVQIFAHGEPNLPVCQWREFCREPFLLHAKCFNGILRELVVTNDGSRIDRIAYYYAPPALEQLEVYGFDVIGRFAPRLLPRSAIYVIFF